MGDRPRAGAGGTIERADHHHPGRIDIVGLGPAGLDRVPAATLALLDDPGRTVIVRTLRHPAAADLAARRRVVTCDDIYESADGFEEVYASIARRVVEAARLGPVAYAVPGSPLVGERSVALLRRLAAETGLLVDVHAAESFLDLLLSELGVDPLDDGLQILDAHRLPDPLVLDKPTVIAQLDRPEVLAEVAVRLDRALPPGTEVTVAVDLGTSEARTLRVGPAGIDPALAGLRTSLHLPASPGGLVGAVHVMHRLREECPWDRQQTHHSLVRYLLEETHELADALAALPVAGEPDWGAYAEVEEELGDVLLQVLFHAAIARQVGAFDIDDVAEQLRLKLVRRHPHVFGDVRAEDADTVRANWDEIKSAEKGAERRSALDGVPTSLPGLSRALEVQRRAARVGFDWSEPRPVLDKIREEAGELEAGLADPVRRAEEIGDLLFSVVNIARHVDVDPEVAIRSAVQRFERRFRAIEEQGPLDGLSLEEMDARWEAAKRAQG